METVVSLTDWHIPFQDHRAFTVALKLVKHIAPKIIVIHEPIDFYQISKYSKDPRRQTQLQRDIKITHHYYDLLRKAAPKSRIIEVESNHTKRLKKYLHTRAPELDSLECLGYKELMRHEDYGIEYKKYFQFRGVLFKHGDIVRQHSGYTAKAELMKEGVSGASGHTHRLGMHFQTLRGGSYVWLESGCLCKTKGVEYIEGTANWQQGISIFMFKDGSKAFQPKVVPIIDHEILWGKDLFKA